MISGQQLGVVLHALSTGYQDRALNMIITGDDIDDHLRRLLVEAVQTADGPSAQVLAIGHVLRDQRQDQFLINECYRAAFYLSTEWVAMSRNPLYAHFVANRSGPVLDKWVHYFPIYLEHLSRYRDRPVRVLEIGVYRGGGLDLWSNFLGPQAVLVGLDVDEAARASVHGRFEVVLGDQEDPEVLADVERRFGPFDIVIDDGGHVMRQQIVSVETLFPLLNDGGTYIVEDTHTSYWQEFGGELGRPDSFIEWSKRRVDDMHWRHHSGIDRTAVWAEALAGLHVYDSVVVLDKHRRFAPFNEIVGSSSYLFADRFSEGVGIELLATRDAALRERDEALARVGQLESAGTPEGQSSLVADTRAAIDEARVTSAELQRARERIADLDERLTSAEGESLRLRNDLLESWQQLRNMRETTSWRLTAPLRALRRMQAP